MVNSDKTKNEKRKMQNHSLKLKIKRKSFEF